MAGSGTGLTIQEADVTVLNETLQSQQQLLQELYAELDVEREASATATNEALSMILRLQAEKSAIKLEASQYKRLADEKIVHAEESLEQYEELIFQKEMEISSLECQIQAYKYKLLSLGCDDLSEFETQFPENLFSERNDAILEDKGFKATARRLGPPSATLPTDFYQKKSITDGDTYVIPEPDLCSSTDIGNFDKGKSSDSRRSSLNSAGGDFNFYGEQIRMLDEKVKEISDCKEIGQNKVSNVKVEPVPQNTSSFEFSNPLRGKSPPKCPRIKTNKDSSEREGSSSASSSSGPIYDVFEVPETGKCNKIFCNVENSLDKSIFEADNRLKKPDLILEETFDSPAEDKIDCIKKSNFSCPKPEKRLCKLRGDVNANCNSPDECEIQWIKKNKLRCENNAKKLLNLRDEKDANCKCKSAPSCASIGVVDYRPELQCLTQRVEQLETERNNKRQEISEEREVEVNLLRELREQLHSVQSEIRSWRPKKPSPSEGVNLLPLTEAMLHFWL